MIGVDVGGTFTDVVAVRDGRIDGHQGPERRRRARRPRSSRGPAASASQGSAVFNHASTMGLNAVITRRLPEGRLPHHRGLPRHPRPRHDLPPARRADRPALAAAVRRRRPPAGAALPAPRRRRADARRRQRAARARRGPGAPPARGAAALRRAGRGDLPAQRLRQPRRTRSSLRELTLEVLGDESRSRSRRRPRRWPRSTRARRRRSIDVFMKLIFGRYSASLDERAARARLRGRAELRRLRGHAAALARGARASRFGSSSPARPPARSRARGWARRSATGNLLCADVGGTSTDVSLVVDGAPFVNDTFELEHDLVINALSTEISSVGAGRRQHRVDLAVGRRPRRPRERGRRPRARRATGAAARRRR